MYSDMQTVCSNITEKATPMYIVDVVVVVVVKIVDDAAELLIFAAAVVWLVVY
jgi:hypothetical protein